MIRSPFAVSASPRGVRRPVQWILLASLLLPLAGATAGKPRASELPWPPKSDVTPIGPGESDSWLVEMAAGDFLDAVVEQGGIDVVVELSDPQGKPLFQADSTEDWEWEEELAWEAEQPGRYRLTVRPLNPKAAPGSYRIRIDGPRPIRPEDRLRVQAVQEMRAALDELGHPEQRLPHMERALALWRESGDRRREAEVLHQIGAVLGDLDQDQEALERFSQALALWQELSVPTKQTWAEAMTLYYQGRLHVKQEPRKAFSYLSKALPLIRQVHQARPEMQIVYHLGYVCDDLALKQDAIGYYEETLRIARRLHADSYEANALNSLGLLYFTLGHPEKASEHCQQALEISQQKKLIEQEASSLNNLALIFERSDPARARDYYQRTRALGREVGDAEIQATALTNLAFLENQAGNPAKARELGREALALGVPNVEVLIRQAIGMSLRGLKDLGASRRELETALALSRDRQDRVRESLVVLELARTLRAQGDLRGALDLLKSGVAVIESIRTGVVEEDLRARFFASRQDVYSLITDTWMTLHQAEPGRGYDAEALRSSEQARARSLLDILGEARADIRQGADPALLDQERRLRVEIEAVEMRRLKLLGSGSDAREVSRRLETLLEEYRKTKANLRVSSPRYAALTQPETLSVERIRSEVLDGRALLLEYALGQERSFLWAVTPDGLQSFTLPPRAVIEDAARRYYKAVSIHPEDPKGPPAQARLRAAADELSRMLLRPVQPLLSGQPLLIVSDGALQYVPFGALPAPSSLDRPKRVPLVVAGHQVVSLPSASVLAVLRQELAGRPVPPMELAVFADPVFQPIETPPTVKRPSSHKGLVLKATATPVRRGFAEDLRGEIDLRKLQRLRFSEKEANAIAALVPTRKRFVALRYRASRANATNGELALYRMVHFATHGLIDSRNPELSSLVLSLFDEKGRPQNGLLRLHDIYNLKLNADLVVLSACQTALGQEIRGEGLVGLTRGFMYAGTPRVLASLWSVDDRATSELMESFYRHMISGRLSPAEALRQAQIELFRDPHRSSPYYWAGFS
ncbi:MAG TPA: CHAT domain-containing protein, partial [Thermoanaerobaculia bacterium]|nr:CHAT domain-containing protein [Thermoanaerobaculia bacterium]